MKLRDWLKLKNKTLEAFGDEVEADKSTVSRWANDESVPSRAKMPLVVQATGGAVTANDFMEPPAVVAACDDEPAGTVGVAR